MDLAESSGYFARIGGERLAVTHVERCGVDLRPGTNQLRGCLGGFRA